MDKEWLSKEVCEINKIIGGYLPDFPDNFEIINVPVRYSVEVGGKRLRPILMREAYKMFAEGKKENDSLHAFMAAIEFIHTYSLVHDDLPAMDNDMYRRGNLTTHAKFGEAFGVLAGDALLNLAFETIAFHMSALKNTDELKVCSKCFEILADKAGSYGMILGQALDVKAEEDKSLTATTDKLDEIYVKKTSALLEASLMIGALLAGASEQDAETLKYAARWAGLAFQIRDDILDVISTAEVLGKPIGSDDRNGKETYVTLLGIDEASIRVNQYTEEALKFLDSIDKDSSILRELFLYLVNREK